MAGGVTFSIFSILNQIRRVTDQIKIAMKPRAEMARIGASSILDSEITHEYFSIVFYFFPYFL